MNGLQLNQFTVGLALVLVLLGFLILAFFKKDQLNDDQRQILRLLSALTAGFAGALLTGEALFKLDTDMGQNAKLAVQGTAGCALFFAVWFTFKQVTSPPKAPDAFHFSVPSGWKFETVVDALVRQEGALAELLGFTPEERSATLQSRELRAKTPVEALKYLRLLAASGSPIREYSVDFDGSLYRLRVGA
jgi:hypothetical protein